MSSNLASLPRPGDSTAKLTILAAARKDPHRWLGLTDHTNPPPQGTDRLAIAWNALNHELTPQVIDGFLEDARTAWPEATQFDLLACDLVKNAPPLSMPEMKVMRESVIIATMPAPPHNLQQHSGGDDA
jgi:hypothetical protein